MKNEKVLCSAFLTFVAIMLVFSFPGIGVAVDFPKKPITCIVAYAAGGETDVQARAISSVAPEYFGQPVVVVNKTGGGGAIGITYVAKARKDGYTILMCGENALAIMPNKKGNPYKFEDLEPVIMISDYPRFLVVGTHRPWKTWEEFIDYAKKHPGEVIAGATGTGGLAHMMLESIPYSTGIELSIVPFKGSAKSIAAILGGHADITAVTIVDAGQHVSKGSMRFLINFDNKRHPKFPDVPTLLEKGINYSDSTKIGIFTPKGTPPEIKKILHDNFKKCLEDKSAIGMFKKFRIPIRYGTGEEFLEFAKEHYLFYGKLMEKIGLK